MPSEFELISIIASKFPKSKQQLNRIFETDAEIVKWGDSLLVFTMDEVSEEEEYIGSLDPYILGWNLTVGVLSDLFAVGADPKFYSHACILSSLFTKDYLERFFEGIRDVLKLSGAYLIGGDLGMGNTWRYIGAAFGTLTKSCLMKRVGVSLGDYIFITGTVGDGNRSALLNYIRNQRSHDILHKFPQEYFTPKFEFRLEESQLIRGYSKVCMDTSDGIIMATETLSELNDCAIILDMNNIPYDSISEEVMKVMNFPREVLFFGSAGEYELMFTINSQRVHDFQKKFENRFEFRKIGIALPGKGIYFLKRTENIDRLHTSDTVDRLLKTERLIPMKNHSIDPRDIGNTEKYIEILVKTVKKLFYE